MSTVAAFFDSPAEIGISLLAWIPFAAIGAVVGFLIGRNKGRGVAGAWLGGLLGCLGWVIAAVLSPDATRGAIPAPPTTPSSQVATAGWHPDPAGRYQHRYHDGTRWTDQVSTDGRQSSDPPTL